jgi:hypothetical protein
VLGLDAAYSASEFVHELKGGCLSKAMLQQGV